MNCILATPKGCKDKFTNMMVNMGRIIQNWERRSGHLQQMMTMRMRVRCIDQGFLDHSMIICMCIGF